MNEVRRFTEQMTTETLMARFNEEMKAAKVQHGKSIKALEKILRLVNLGKTEIGKQLQTMTEQRNAVRESIPVIVEQQTAPLKAELKVCQ